jgi:hypothetical protein
VGAHRDIAGPLAQHLLELAADRGPECTTDDLSGRCYRSGEALALECYRRGFAAAVAELQAREAAALEDAPTQPRIAATCAESQTLPIARGLWDADTPARPVDVAKLRDSRRG